MSKKIVIPSVVLIVISSIIVFVYFFVINKDTEGGTFTNKSGLQIAIYEWNIDSSTALDKYENPNLNDLFSASSDFAAAEFTLGRFPFQYLSLLRSLLL